MSHCKSRKGFQVRPQRSLYPCRGTFGGSQVKGYFALAQVKHMAGGGKGGKESHEVPWGSSHPLVLQAESVPSKHAILQSEFARTKEATPVLLAQPQTIPHPAA